MYRFARLSSQIARAQVAFSTSIRAAATPTALPASTRDPAAQVFDQHMSRGFTELQSSNLDAAREAFQAASLLQPSHSVALRPS